MKLITVAAHSFWSLTLAIDDNKKSGKRKGEWENGQKLECASKAFSFNRYVSLNIASNILLLDVVVIVAAQFKWSCSIGIGIGIDVVGACNSVNNFQLSFFPSLLFKFFFTSNCTELDCIYMWFVAVIVNIRFRFIF